MDKTSKKYLKLKEIMESVGGLHGPYTNRPPFTEPNIFDIGEGWYDIVGHLIVDLVAMGWDRHSYQVKEKFGGLRFYIGGAEKEIHDRITKAEAESYHVCEVCGEPGKLRQTGWVLTLCAPCYKEHKKAK